MKKEKNKIIIRSKGEFTIKSNYNVYELNLENGIILLAPLAIVGEKKGMIVYELSKEKEMHLYMPAINKYNAKVKFNRILKSVR